MIVAALCLRLKRCFVTETYQLLALENNFAVKQTKVYYVLALRIYLGPTFSRHIDNLTREYKTQSVTLLVLMRMILIIFIFKILTLKFL